MKIKMNAPDYFKEHKQLIKLLLSTQRAFLKEAKKQIAEVKKQKIKLKKIKI
jgi:hypothetical protein